MVAATPEPSRSSARLPVGLALLTGLLILRLPLLTGFDTFVQQRPTWLLPTFEWGTYILTALLLVWERDRLELFHVDGWALAIYLGAPLLTLLSSDQLFRSWVQIGSVAFVLLAFVVTRPKLPKLRSHTEIWTGVAVGVMLGIFFALCGQLHWNARMALRPSPDLSILPSMVLVQIARAASFEEPLFRAFLWGYLKLAGWKDRTIWLLQSRFGLWCRPAGWSSAGSHGVPAASAPAC